MNDNKFNFVPEGLNRLDRRNNYQEDPTHSSLKDKREKRDELKEKKFLPQLQKPTVSADQEKATPSGNE